MAPLGSAIDLSGTHNRGVKSMSAMVPVVRLVRYVAVSDAELKKIADLLGIPEAPKGKSVSHELHLVPRKGKVGTKPSKKPGGRKR